VEEGLDAPPSRISGFSVVQVFQTSAMADAYMAAVNRRSYQECLLRRFFQGAAS